MSDSQQPSDALCRGCRHYYVTYQAATPHGCRRFGFASATLPARLVQIYSKQPCAEATAAGNLRREKS